MKISIVTLGCKVNKYESDAIMHSLSEKGYEVFDGLREADLYIINTCAVTGEAEKKSRQAIARCRNQNKNAKILVCGCASQKNSLQFEEKGVDFIGGTARKNFIAQYVDLIACGESFEKQNLSALPLEYEKEDFATQSRVRAYIKIQDGCNNFCSYCIIPYLRGRSRSRELDDILNEVKALPNEVKEIVLTGINVTDYKISGKSGLILLLSELDKFGKRIRLSSLEETIVDEEFVKALASLKNFCPFFHLSLQSGSAKVLKDMNRKYTPEDFEKSVNLIRKYFPTAGITTDVIVGFPTETDDLFEESMHFIEKIGFSGLHIFQYSKRDGTVASKLKDLSSQLKKQRAKRLEELDERLRKTFIAQNKGGKVLVEEKEGDFYVGYSENYIKCYIDSDQDITNQVIEVEFEKPYLEGEKVKIKQN